VKNSERTMDARARGGRGLPLLLQRLPKTTGRLLPAIFGFGIIALPVALYLLS
jgi:hypothetical protein